MTGGEHQPQQVIAHVVVHRRLEIRLGQLVSHIEFMPQFGMLGLESLVPAQVVDGAMLGGGHEPGARIVGHS